jgi:peptide/nickel transport system permease protein
VSGFIVRRLLATLVVLAIVSLLSFSLMQLVPGDPALVLAGIGATADQVQHIRQEFGLDQPFAVQMLRWYGGLLHGNLGDSVLLGESVVKAIAEHVPATVSVALFASVLSVVVGIGSGILAATRQGQWIDRIVMGAAVFGVSVPSFWLGLLLMVLFAVKLDWLPAGGYVPLAQDPWQWFRSLVLPGVSLALLQIGYLAQIARNALIEVLRQDFVRTARAKGLADWTVIMKHALSNAMLPILTVTGIMFSLLLSGSVVTETVFSVPGLGRLMASAILSRDYPVIQGTLLLTAAAFAIINLLVDILYVMADPRVAYE